MPHACWILTFLARFSPLHTDALDSCRAVWLEALPQTGRTHQIRVHLHHVGLPIVGDHVYGKGSHLWGTSGSDTCASSDGLTLTRQGESHENIQPGMKNEAFGEPMERGSIHVVGPSSEVIPHQALHALSLDLVHPYTKERETFIAIIPDDITQAAKLLHLPIPMCFTSRRR